MDHAVKLTLSTHAPGLVRRSFETRYAETIERSLLDDVKIMASELVSNSVLHSGRPTDDPIATTATVSDRVLRVEVIDRGEGADPLLPRSSHPPSGLGMVEILSDRWASHRSSFHVWFEVDVVTAGTSLIRANPS